MSLCLTKRQLIKLVAFLAVRTEGAPGIKWAGVQSCCSTPHSAERGTLGRTMRGVAQRPAQSLAAADASQGRASGRARSPRLTWACGAGPWDVLPPCGRSWNCTRGPGGAGGDRAPSATPGLGEPGVPPRRWPPALCQDGAVLARGCPACQPLVTTRVPGQLRNSVCHFLHFS